MSVTEMDLKCYRNLNMKIHAYIAIQIDFVVQPQAGMIMA
jgi:hypothetical protein